MSEREKKKTKIQLYICIVIFIILLTELIFCVRKYIKYTTEEKVNYTEEGKVNYKVYLKANDFYEEDYLKEDMIYVASLINQISVDFDYSFESEGKEEVDFDYDIVAKLVIKDSTGDKIFFEKNYDLEHADDKKIDSKEKRFNKKVTIDYERFNSLSSSFKTKYGIDSASYLRVMLNIKKSSKDLELEESNMYIDIPLSERTVKITLTPMDLQNKDEIIREREVIASRTIYIIFILVAGILVLLDILTIRLVRSKRNRYQITVDRILREYDRLIVETRMQPEIKDKNVIKLYEFKELLDVRDNLKLPILYCEIKKGEYSSFYISVDKDIYIYDLKNEDK